MYFALPWPFPRSKRSLRWAYWNFKEGDLPFISLLCQGPEGWTKESSCSDCTLFLPHLCNLRMEGNFYLPFLDSLRFSHIQGDRFEQPLLVMSPVRESVRQISHPHFFFLSRKMFCYEGTSWEKSSGSELSQTICLIPFCTAYERPKMSASVKTHRIYELVSCSCARGMFSIAQDGTTLIMGGKPRQGSVRGEFDVSNLNFCK